MKYWLEWIMLYNMVRNWMYNRSELVLFYLYDVLVYLFIGEDIEPKEPKDDMDDA